jgi:ABC-type dipeptide/oligopeptide/nickel transport system ATPase component
VPVPDPERAQRAPRPQPPEPADAAAASGTSPAGCPYAGRCPHTMEICRTTMPPLVDYAPRLGESAPHWAACHWTEQQVEQPVRRGSCQP